MRTYLAVNLDGTEIVFSSLPQRCGDFWVGLSEDEAGWDEDFSVILPKGTIKKLIGKELTWEDEPYRFE